MMVRNADFANWTDVMDPFTPPAGERAKALTRPRPGHADLAGALKLGLHDARDVLERVERALDDGAGGGGRGVQGAARAPAASRSCVTSRASPTWRRRRSRARRRELRAARDAAEASDGALRRRGARRRRMVEAIKAAQKDGDSRRRRRRGGGLGTCRRGSARTSSGTSGSTGGSRMALMSIQAMKGVEIGARLRRGGDGAARRCSIPSSTTASASCGRPTTWAASRAASPTASRWWRARR